MPVRGTSQASSTPVEAILIAPTRDVERQLRESRQLLAALVQYLGGEVKIPVSYLEAITPDHHLQVKESDDCSEVWYRVYVEKEHR
jgi:hypothetical protein